MTKRNEGRFGRGWLMGMALGMLVVLGGCASTPLPEIRYYLLDTEVAFAEVRTITVEQVVVPDYLERSNIVLAVSGSEIRPALFHLWGEPLVDGVRRTLELELNALANGEGKEVSVVIERFHGSENGTVVLSGRWMLSDGERSGEMYGFQIETRQEADGYQSLVAAHVAALRMLAGEIGEKSE